MSKEVKFEDKIKELETIINELESGEIDLDSSIEKYMEAMKIVEFCDKKLKGYEEKITKVLSDDGTLKDFKLEEDIQ